MSKTTTAKLANMVCDEDNQCVGDAVYSVGHRTYSVRGSWTKMNKDGTITVSYKIARPKDAVQVTPVRWGVLAIVVAVTVFIILLLIYNGSTRRNR